MTTNPSSMAVLALAASSVLLSPGARQGHAFLQPRPSARTLGRVAAPPFRGPLGAVADAADVAAPQAPAAAVPRTRYDSVVCGGGPAGLLAAISLARLYGPDHRIAVVERLPGRPPAPSDAAVWSDVARFYLLGIGFRGQAALKSCGAFDDFAEHSVEVRGRRDWAPGKTGVEDGRVTLSEGDAAGSRVLARDKLVGVLYHHLLDNYADCDVDLLYGYEAEPLDFGEDDADPVTLRISKCAATQPEGWQDAEDGTCDAEAAVVARAGLLVGADGSARTVANAMERADAARVEGAHPLVRPFLRPFRVTRYADDNARVYKSLPLRLPDSWPRNLNYSARNDRMTLEALPADDDGSMCALLLMKPGDAMAEADVPAEEFRKLFDDLWPQFSDLVSDDEIARVATKKAATLPAFRFAGPRLAMGGRTVVLGDAAHTVKPYFGLGANTALEDVRVLADILRSNDGDVPASTREYSQRKSKDAEALVKISRSMDRPGKRMFAYFLLPLILDSTFHKLAPAIFGPNMFGMFKKRGMGFRQIQKRKRLDRLMQAACVSALMAGVARGMGAAVGGVARATGRSRIAVTAASVSVVALLSAVKRVTGAKETEE